MGRIEGRLENERQEGKATKTYNVIRYECDEKTTVNSDVCTSGDYSLGYLSTPEAALPPAIPPNIIQGTRPEMAS